MSEYVDMHPTAQIGSLYPTPIQNCEAVESLSKNLKGAGMVCLFSSCLYGFYPSTLFLSFLPQYKNTNVRLTGHSKLSVGVSVSMCGCSSLVPVMDQ